MEFIQLEAFVQVVRDGNFTHAADSLGLTQPAVSTRIALLEAHLGGALFERRGRQLHLTPLGDLFLPYAERVLAVIADSKQAVESLRAGRLGQIKIAAPTPFVIGFLVEVLPRFRDKFPGVDILIRERNKTTIFDMLRDKTIILGIVNAPVFDRGIRQIVHFEDPIRAVVSPTHPLAIHQNQPINMEAIYQHTIFRVSMFPKMTAFIDEVAEHGRSGSGGAVISLPMVMALRMVILGKGITFLPESYIKEPVEAGQLIFVNIADMPYLESTPVVISLKDRRLDDVHKAFIDTLEAYWQSLRSR